MAPRFAGMSKPQGLLATALLLTASCIANAQPTCPVNIQPLESKRPKPSASSVFDELSGKELAAVNKFLLSRPELALVPYDKAGPTDNVLFMAEMLLPPKEQVLAHIDGKGPKPERKAFAILLLYQHKPPKCMQVEVGPLPNPTYYKELVYPKQPQNISINSRPISAPEYAGFEELYAKTMKVLDPVVYEATGFKYDPDTCGDKCLTWTDGGPRGSAATYRKVWTWMIRSVEGSYINPIGLQLYIDSTSTKFEEWKVDKIMWAGRMFNNTDEIVAWFKANNNTSAGYRLPGYDTPAQRKFSTFEVRNKTTDRGTVPGATFYEPAGKRYKVDGKLVTWQGWSFRVGLRSSVGMRLFDIQYKGKRIAYEISLQQALAAYGGNPKTDPMQSTTFYLDSAWGMGPKHYELIHEYDCPGTAIYFDFWHLYDSAKPYKNQNCLCMYEANLGAPMRRHIDFPQGWAASIKQYALVIRGMSSVYNYDYTYEWLFYTDGTFESKVTPYGYLQATMHTSAADNEFGYRHSQSVGGTVHQHTWNWKVDLDVAGTSNSVQLDKIKVHPIETPWHDDFKTTYSLKVDREFVENEDAARLTVDMHKPAVVKVVNEEAKNRYGALRSYQIHVSKYQYNIWPQDTYWLRSARWLDHTIAFTVRKDNEPDVNTMFDQSTPYETVADIARFTDGESIRGKDLVAWVASGLWHIPVSEDAPNSPGTAHYAGFVLRPYNYFNEDEALDTREIALYRKKEDGKPWVRVRSYEGRARACVPTVTKFGFSGQQEEWEE